MTNRRIHIILLFLLALCSFILHSCLKEKYDEIDSGVLNRETVLSDNVFIIDTINFLDPIISGQSFTFSINGNIPDINNGDIVVVQYSGGYIRRISELDIRSDQFSFIGDTVAITEVLDQYNLNDNIHLNVNESDIVIFQKEGVKIDGDGKIVIEGLDLFQGVVESDLLMVKVVNCTISFNPVINRKLDIRTISQDTSGINSIEVFLEGDLNISTDYSIQSGIITSSFSDSIKILELNYSGFFYGPVPVVINLEFYIGFEVERTNKHINIQSSYISNVSSGFGAVLDTDIWDNRWETDSLSGTASDSILWDRNSNTNFQLFVKPKISFTIANENGPEINLKSFYDFKGTFQDKDTTWSLEVNSGLSGELKFPMNIFDENKDDYNRGSDYLNMFLENNSGVHTNLAPTALFSVNQMTGELLTDFIFNPASSFDDIDETDSLKIKWDWDGDEHYDTDYELLTEVHHSFKKKGNYSVSLVVKDSKNMTDTTSMIVKVESSPFDLKASFIVDPVEGGSKLTVFTFDATGCQNFVDHESGKLTVRWDWENDGIWDTQYSEEKIIKHQFDVSIPHIVKLELQNNDGYLDETTKLVNVINLEPVADFNVSPEIGTTETTFIFDASLSYDQDGGQERLMYRWDWENNGIWDDGWLTTEVISHQYDYPGVFYVKLEVKDEFGAVVSKIKSVYIKPDNYSPIGGFTVSPTIGDTQTIFYFDPSSSYDSETDYEDLRIRWDWNNDFVWDTDFYLIKDTIHNYPETGAYVINMEIMDGAGATDTVFSSVFVEAFNELPVAFFSVNPESGNTITDFSFDASGSTDREDPMPNLLVKWDWENDGFWDTQYTTEKNVVRRFSIPGTYTIALKVKDSGNKTSIYTKDITVE